MLRAAHSMGLEAGRRPPAAGGLPRLGQAALLSCSLHRAALKRVARQLLPLRCDAPTRGCLGYLVHTARTSSPATARSRKDAHAAVAAGAGVSGDSGVSAAVAATPVATVAAAILQPRLGARDGNSCPQWAVERPKGVAAATRGTADLLGLDCGYISWRRSRSDYCNQKSGSKARPSPLLSCPCHRCTSCCARKVIFPPKPSSALCSTTLLTSNVTSPLRRSTKQGAPPGRSLPPARPAGRGGTAATWRRSWAEIR
jgi:hypothetical protein